MNILRRIKVNHPSSVPDSQGKQDSSPYSQGRQDSSPDQNEQTSSNGIVVNRRQCKGNEFNIMVATVYGEAGNSSLAARKAVAHVIMNRIGYKEWGNCHDVKSVISQKDQFKAYPDHLEYKKAYNYLGNTGAGEYPNDDEIRIIDETKDAVCQIYSGLEKDTTGGAVLYYSPKARLNNNSQQAAKPPWDYELIDSISKKTIGLKDEDDFAFFKYK